MKIFFKDTELCNIDNVYNYDYEEAQGEISDFNNVIEEEKLIDDTINASIEIKSEKYPITIKSIEESELTFIWNKCNPFLLRAEEYLNNKYYDDSIDFEKCEKAINFELHKDLKEFYKKIGFRKIKGFLSPHQIRPTENWGQWFVECIDIELFNIEDKNDIKSFIEEKFKVWTGGYDFGHRIWIGSLEDNRGDMLILFNNDNGKIEWIDTEYGGFGNLDEDPNGILADSIDELIKIIDKNDKENHKPLNPEIDDFYEIKKLFGISRFGRFGLPYDIEYLKDNFEDLPKVLIDYYVELGGHYALNSTQDRLIPPEDVYMSDDGYLVFYEENQEACIWGIKEDDLSMDNPPVYVSDCEIEDWKKESDTLTEFFIIMAYMQGSLGLPYTCDEIYEIDENGAESIRKHFKNKGVSMKGWMEVEFYGDNETDIITLIKNDDFYNLSVGSSVKSNFEKIEKFINNI